MQVVFVLFSRGGWTGRFYRFLARRIIRLCTAYVLAVDRKISGKFLEIRKS